MKTKTVKVSGTNKGNSVLHVVGNKGSVLRLGRLMAPGKFKLLQNNVGLSYDGAVMDITGGHNDAQTREEFGAYVRGKEGKLSFKVLTVAEAKKLCGTKRIIKRNGHNVTISTTKGEVTQYMPSIETTAKGKELFFQWESVKAPEGAKHYGQLVK